MESRFATRRADTVYVKASVSNSIGLFQWDSNQMTIRCKMRLDDVISNAWGGKKAFFRCEYDSKLAEDVGFQKATPSGHAEYVIDNPKATEQLVIGGYYYVDFTPVS